MVGAPRRGGGRGLGAGAGAGPLPAAAAADASALRALPAHGQVLPGQRSGGPKLLPWQSRPPRPQRDGAAGRGGRSPRPAEPAQAPRIAHSAVTAVGTGWGGGAVGKRLVAAGRGWW